MTLSQTQSFKIILLQLEKENRMETYTLEEVSNILKITRRTIYNYIKNGDLKAVKIGKYWRVSEANLQDFIENGTKKRG